MKAYMVMTDGSRDLASVNAEIQRAIDCLTVDDFKMQFRFYLFWDRLRMPVIMMQNIIWGFCCVRRPEKPCRLQMIPAWIQRGIKKAGFWVIREKTVVILNADRHWNI